jgi:hypothetical protein
MEDRIPRQWLIIAPREAGKSTFCAQMSPEYLVADLDGRWKEQEKTAAGKSYRITESEPLAIVREMDKLYPNIGSYVKTIIIDSGTAVLDYLGSKGRLLEAEARASNKKFNMNDVHRMKADTMRLLRFAVLRWHVDYAWIFHTENRMESGKEKVRTTISNTELEAMKANLNAILTIVTDKNGMRGIRVEWSRSSKAAAGQVIWDLDGMWRNVPERLDVFLQNFTGNEQYNGNVYSDKWLMKYLAEKGVNFLDMHELYHKLDIKEELYWFDRRGWGELIKKALPEPAK